MSIILREGKQGRFVEWQKSKQTSEFLFLFSVSDHSNLPEIVNKVLSQEMQKIFISQDLESFNEQFLKCNSTSIQHLLSGWFVLLCFKCDEFGVVCL